MIKYVVKSNGTKVPFEVEKLRKWSTFAAGKGVSWSEIELEAIKRCYEGCSTKDLHNAMIAACVDKKEQKYSDQAGRLLLGEIYKEAHGGFHSIPKLEDYYKDMVEKGFWANMGYTTTELKLLDKVIDHNKNLSYGYSVLRQMKDKYMVKDAIADITHESPQFSFMGIAMFVMKNQPVERRLEDIVKVYTYTSDLKINLPSPYLTALRTNIKGAASCCLFYADDNADSLAIANYLAHKFTLANSGIGVMLQTRTTGDGVKNNRIKHSGLLPYYRWMQSGVTASKQSSRGGAATVTYTILEPDIEDLIRLKHPTTPAEKQIPLLDYSVVINNAFLRRAATGKDWMLVSFKDAPELYDALYKSETEFEEVYEKVSRRRIKKTIVNARDLLSDFIDQQLATGRNYVTFADNANNHTPFIDRIYQSNLCVAPETKVLTDNGYKIISELEGKSVNVWNGQEWSETIVRKTGTNQKLIKVKTNSGQELVCTPYHKFYVQKGYSRGTGENKLTIIEVKASDLKVGDKLIKFELPIIEGSKELSLAYENGFYSGYGCEVVREENQRVYLYNEKRKLLPYFSDYLFHTVQEDQDREILTYKARLEDKFFVPGSSYTIKSRLDWLSGYLDADGCVYRNGENQQLTACSTEKSFLDLIQLMLQELGVESKITIASEKGIKKLPLNDGSGEKGDFVCKEAWRLLIPSNQTQLLYTMGLNTKRLSVKKHKPNRDARHFIKIASIQDEGRYDDTFCFTEEKRNMGMFNGLLTGQCQEIFLPTKPFYNMEDLYSGENLDTSELALCFLASIVAGRVTKEEYEDVAYYTVLLIDNVIEEMDYPFKHTELTAKKRRSIGVGITNLAHYLASNKLSYSSTEGKILMHELAERHYYWLAKASLKLSKEKGVAEWMHKTKWVDGWLPIDSYKKDVDTIADFKLHFDWEELRKDIKENGGIRNSVLMAIAPNESSSLVSNTTNSLYPIRNPMMYKQSEKGNLLFIVPEYDKLKEFYDIAWDVPNRDLIEMYGIFTKFADQGISIDRYVDYSKLLDGKVSKKDQMQQIFYASKYGLKSLYYLNSKTKAADSLAQMDVGTIEESDCESCKL